MVAFNEAADSPTFDIELNGQKARREGWIAWDDIDDFFEQVFPTAYFDSPLGAEFPGRPLLTAVSMHLEPWPNKPTNEDVTEDFDQVNTYQRAKVSVQYGFTFQDEEDPVDFLTHRWTSGAEFLSLPTGGLVWADDESAVASETNGGIVIPSIEHAMQWSRIFAPPFEVIRDRMGTVNQSPLNFSTGTIAAETLMFQGANMERQVTSQGAGAWRLDYQFSERRIREAGTGTAAGWNHFWRTGESSGFSRMKFVFEDQLYDIYAQKSFAELFQQSG